MRPKPTPLVGAAAGLGYRALLLDIDGTLLDARDRISEATHAIARRLRKAGLKIYLATGRSIEGARRVHAELDLDTPLICYNGLVVFDPLEDEWLYHRRLEDESIVPILQLARTRSRFFFLFHKDKKFTLPIETPEHRAMAEILKNVVEVPGAKLPQKDVTKINLYCPSASVDATVQDLAKLDSRLRMDRFPLSSIPAFAKLDLTYLDVQPKNDGKAQALRYLEEFEGIPAGAVIAFGDQVNDRPMLRGAGLGVAVANAPRSIRQEADLVVDTNTKDGVAKFLEVLFQEPDPSDPPEAGS